MTSSLQPSMQLHKFDDVGLSRLQHLFVCMYQSDFQSPFLFTRAFGLYFYLMYSDIIVQVLDVILGTICMWDLSSCYLSGSCLCQHTLYISSRGFPDSSLFLLCLGGHRYASPAAYSIGTHSSKRLVAPVSLASSGSSSFNTLVYLILLSLTSPSMSSD